MKPNEARALENLPSVEGGDQLLIQGAMMPIDKLGQNIASTVPDMLQPQ